MRKPVEDKTKTIHIVVNQTHWGERGKVLCEGRPINLKGVNYVTSVSKVTCRQCGELFIRKQESYLAHHKERLGLQ